MDKITDMFESIKITEENEEIINEAKKYAENGKYEKRLQISKMRYKKIMKKKISQQKCIQMNFAIKN